MAGPFNETAGALWAFQFGGSWTTPGVTVSEDFNVVPGVLVIRVGLTYVAATTAAIGIVEYHDANRRAPVNFGSYPGWATHVRARVGAFTIGLHVARGVAKGWFYAQAWA